MKHILRQLTLSAAAMASIGAIAQQNPVRPTVPEGSFHCFRGMPASEINYIPRPADRVMRAEKLGNSKYDNTDGHDLREVPTEGVYPVLVLLVEFQDCAFTQGKDDPRALVNDMLNGENFTFQGATGSASAFYQAVSGGQFIPRYDVYGPVKVSKDTRQYVSPDEYEYFIDAEGKEQQKYPASLMVEEAIKAIDPEVDFSKYDSNGDGLVDFVYIFHAGKGATTGGMQSSTIWPHAFTLEAGIGETVKADGVEVNRYATSAELGRNNKLSGIGTFCHEFGHVLGLPDLYDTANNGSTKANFTPGTFSCMDSGNYNNDEHTPPFFSAYEQYSLEWMLPKTITGGGDFVMLPVSARKYAYKFETESNPQEYFLVEARDNQSYDKYLESYGLAVWHIDFDKTIWDRNSPNNNDNHHRIDLIEADNDKQASSRDGDLFPGVNGVCEFNKDISPAFIDWNNKSLGYSFSKIKRNFDGTVEFSLESEAGNEMTGADIEDADLRLVSAGSDRITFTFDAVPGATEYYVSVYPLDKFDGTYITDYVDGWHYASVTVENGSAVVTVDGLEPGKQYGILAYAANDSNASRTDDPLVVRTVADKFEEARTELFASSLEDNTGTPATAIEWTPVSGADSYELTIATRSEVMTDEAYEDVTLDFSENIVPEDWASAGDIDFNQRYCGNAAPSFKFPTNGSYLQTPKFEHEIKSVSFWSRKRFDEDNYSLQVYGIDADGRLILAEEVDDLTRTGSTHTVGIPAGCYALKFIYFFTTTGLDCNIDDIAISFTPGYALTPVTGLDVKDYSETVRIVRGLQPDTEYVAYVTPGRGTEKGLRSHELTFKPSDLPEASGVESVEIETAKGFGIDNGMLIAPADTGYDLYTAEGLCLGRGLLGNRTLPGRGLYIVRTAAATAKLAW